MVLFVTILVSVGGIMALRGGGLVNIEVVIFVGVTLGVSTLIFMGLTNQYIHTG